MPDDTIPNTPNDVTNSPQESQPKKVQKIVFSLPVDHVGTTVYVKGWKFEENSNAPIVIIHDLGELPYLVLLSLEPVEDV